MTRQIALLRPDQIRAEMQRKPLAYLPVGPLEWHGPHLPYGVDPLNAARTCELCAEKTGGLVFPAFYWGTERERDPQMLSWLGFEADTWIEGMDFPANGLPSLYASEDAFGVALREQVRLILNLGFKQLVLVSGHGASNHLAVMERLSAEFSAHRGVSVITALAFGRDEDGSLKVGHASGLETALMMALHPETVALDKLPPLPEPLKNVNYAIVDYATFMGSPMPDHTVRPDDDPRRASEAAGRAALLRTVAQIVARVQQLP